MTVSGAEATAPEATWWGRLSYTAALAKQVEAHATRVAAETGDRFFYLEHEPVITYGRGTSPGDLQKAPHNIPAHAVSRGGLATYHGPGQLVGYIIMNLAERAEGQQADIHAYLRALETGLIRFVQSEFGLQAGLRQDFTGVWTVPAAGEPVGRKLASIGVSARKWVTSHGFALNIHPDMTGFQSIVPCGITDAEMSSVELELKRLGRSLDVRPVEQWAISAHRHIIQALRDAGWLKVRSSASVPAK